jgi:hypothetical protein
MARASYTTWATISGARSISRRLDRGVLGQFQSTYTAEQQERLPQPGARADHGLGLSDRDRRHEEEDLTQLRIVQQAHDGKVAGEQGQQGGGVEDAGRPSQETNESRGVRATSGDPLGQAAVSVVHGCPVCGLLRWGHRPRSRFAEKSHESLGRPQWPVLDPAVCHGVSLELDRDPIPRRRATLWITGWPETCAH